MFDLLTILAIFGVFLLAGTIKGVVGMGLPTTAIGLMTIVTDPRTAIAITLLPMLTSNAWQVYRSKKTVETLVRYRLFGIVLLVTITLTLLASKNAAQELLLLILGFTLLLFVTVSATKWAPRIPQSQDQAAQAIGGTVAGVLGGLTAVWAPPMAVYLTARNVGKDEFVRATGLLILVGTIPLCIGYLGQSHLTWGLFLLSCVALPSTFIGFSIGEKIRGIVSEQAFRTTLLVFFAVMALNLMRRALF